MKRLIVLALLLAGCTTFQSGMGQKIDPEKIAAIRIGQTTKNDILGAFGNPHSISTTSGGNEVYKFVYMNTKSETGIILPTIKVDTEYQELNVTFKDNVVVDFSSTRR